MSPIRSLLTASFIALFLLLTLTLSPPLSLIVSVLVVDLYVFQMATEKAKRARDLIHQQYVHSRVENMREGEGGGSAEEAPEEGI